MIFKMLDTIFDFRKNKFFMIFQILKLPPCPPGGRIWTNMQRAQLGPPMVHLAKFDQNRLKDLGARRVDDRQTRKQTQAIIRAILRIGPTKIHSELWRMRRPFCLSCLRCSCSCLSRTMLKVNKDGTLNSQLLPPFFPYPNYKQWLHAQFW